MIATGREISTGASTFGVLGYPEKFFRFDFTSFRPCHSFETVTFSDLHVSQKIALEAPIFRFATSETFLSLFRNCDRMRWFFSTGREVRNVDLSACKWLPARSEAGAAE